MQNQEIEHKYLLRGDDYRSLATKQYVIRQGYLSVGGPLSRTVRVRRKGEKAYLTIKSPAPEGHIGRFEWEREIAVEDAEALFTQCVCPLIDKVRYIVPYEGVTIEVDEFHGLNEGLVLAEIELESETQTFSVPAWIGEDVTSDARYYNSYLTQHPYTSWSEC